MGVDFGEKRIGIAVSDPTNTVATPLETVIRRRGKRPPLGRLAQVAAERVVKTLSDVVDEVVHHLLDVAFALDRFGVDDAQDSATTVPAFRARSGRRCSHRSAAVRPRPAKAAASDSTSPSTSCNSTTATSPSSRSPVTPSSPFVCRWSLASRRGDASGDRGGILVAGSLYLVGATIGELG